MTNDELAAAFPLPAAHEVDALHTRLVRRAERERVLDVSFRTVGSPYGELLLAATPAGLVRVAFEIEGHDAVLEGLARMLSPRMLRSGRGTDDAARQLDEYFARRRRAFDVRVDLQLAHGFRRSVVEYLPHIAYGATASYSDVARAVGNATAVRAVGSACARNPLPLVLPCHRVVRSDGSIGNYGGGTAMKAALLAMEGAS
jgi:methylated-DNA-[protein]-cysteine S-methyltransferase